MYLFYNYLNVFSAPLICLYALGKGPSWIFTAYFIALVIHPLFDFVINKYFKEKFKSLNGGRSSSWLYQIPLYLAVPFQILLVIYAAFSANASGDYSEAILAGALCGLSGGVLGMGTAHELTHRNNKWERLYGILMLYVVNYPYFHLEHRWHHIMLGTEKDPDTARKGESIYAFLYRSIPQGWMDSWRLEAKRLKNLNKNSFNLKNQMLLVSLFQVLIMLFIYLLIGPLSLVMYVTQGLITIVLLKWINYVEHYGLMRKKINGNLEPISSKHSWDSSSPLTNFSLFNLGFHSLHHIKPNVPYQDLPDENHEWNELPTGYSGMMMVALIPNLYKNIMHKKINELEKQVYA